MRRRCVWPSPAWSQNLSVLHTDTARTEFVVLPPHWCACPSAPLGGRGGRASRCGRPRRCQSGTLDARAHMHHLGSALGAVRGGPGVRQWRPLPLFVGAGVSGSGERLMKRPAKSPIPVCATMWPIEEHCSWAGMLSGDALLVTSRASPETRHAQASPPVHCHCDVPSRRDGRGEPIPDFQNESSTTCLFVVARSLGMATSSPSGAWFHRWLRQGHCRAVGAAQQQQQHSGSESGLIPTSRPATGCSQGART